MSGPQREPPMSKHDQDLLQLTLQLRCKAEKEKYAKFHGDTLIGNPIVPKIGTWEDFKSVIQPKNWPALMRAADVYIKGNGLDKQALASVVSSVSDYSVNRQKFLDGSVKQKYDMMLHPPLTYLGDAFQYRTADGKFNSATNPHLGQAGAPYAKTVPSKTAPLGALPDPGDLFDKLMARQEGGRDSKSGLSAMLIYHATIIIHDIFRTNDDDKNISDSSSYLDLSPLYGYTTEMQRKVRDDKYKLGLLKPDTFAEDRLLRQPPGVCIMLVMYNRYHNYAARQLLRINENGRFRVPVKYEKTKLVSFVKEYLSKSREKGKTEVLSSTVLDLCDEYGKVFKAAEAARPRAVPEPPKKQPGETPDQQKQREAAQKKWDKVNLDLVKLEKVLEGLLGDKMVDLQQTSEDFKIEREAFEAAWQAAWDKQDDDLFNTARLITCGMYIQISVHDYLRALMGFHQFDTNFTLDPRADFDQKKTSRGIGNQVTVEFNLLYRFHCAISRRDEDYTKDYMTKVMKFKDPDNVPLPAFVGAMRYGKEMEAEKVKNGTKAQPWEVTFGIPDESKPEAAGSNTASDNGSDSGISGVTAAEAPKNAKRFQNFTRNAVTNLFDDRQMLDELTTAMDDPISNFGPRNVPKCLKPVEIMGIIQARKWGTGTLNDFRDFFGLPRHATFESVTKNLEIQNALRDLYEHPDMIELYPGIFCESDENMGLDPGPTESSSALWSAIFSDAITLVRSDRFYTVDWNTNSLTSWGMKEVTPNNEVCKSSVFHRLLQRAFPGWFPSDTIRFFHPFYTAKQNGIYAEAQNYTNLFKETAAKKKAKEQKEPTPDTIVAAPVQKPKKPLYLHRYEDVYKILLDVQSQNFTNPAYFYEDNLPEVVKQVLNPKLKAPEDPFNSLAKYVKDMEEDLKKYLDELMTEIVKREAISMTNSTFQIDATRDFAIPVVTRYVADFLGFSSKLRKVATGGKDIYSENEIYQHITNCQVFLTYNADETKWMQRRREFQTSMKKLIALTQGGTIWEASQWDITKALFGKKKTNAMHDLGVFVARQVLTYEKDQKKAAAILLLICLDFAYNAVVSFTATLDGYMTELYEAADSRPKTIKLESENTQVEPEATQVDSEATQLEPETIQLESETTQLEPETTQLKPKTTKLEPRWIGVQRCVFSNEPKAGKELGKMVRLMAQEMVNLPIVRKASEAGEYEFEDTTKGTKVKIEKGDTVILDISKAIHELTAKVKADRAKAGPKDDQAQVGLQMDETQVGLQTDQAEIEKKKIRLLNSQLSIADKYGVFSPRRFATISLTSMIKFIAQMKNPRRGHDTQGNLKRIELDPTPEGYANYMAPMRVDWIQEQARHLGEDEAKKIVTDGDLRPKTDTYLTPTWDEFVPFPMTWKIRFDGFGESDYKDGTNPYGRVKTVPGLTDFEPPMYQPQGPSTVGGAFATPVCVCAGVGAEDKDHCPCLSHTKKKPEHKIHAVSTGCGMGS